MTKFWLVYSTALVAASALLYAQGTAPGMGSGMHRGMKGMAGPQGTPRMMGMRDDSHSQIHRVVMTPYLLPALKTELNLSVEQIAALERVKGDLRQHNAGLPEKIAAKQKDMDKALASGNIPERERFQELAGLRADLLFHSADATGKMRAILSETQRTKFAAMTMAELHKALMSAGTMMELHEMMQATGEMPMGQMGQMDQMMPGQSAPGGAATDHGAMGHEAK